MKTLILPVDLAGTFVFALSGAVAGVKHRLDLFGIVVVSLAASTFGGIARDVLIGAVPPVAIADWKYIPISLLAGFTVFFRYHLPTSWRNHLLMIDAAGLALCSVSGTLKALSFQLPPVAAVLLGVLTGIGGGIARDLLVSEIPIVLRADLYAVAALAGASVVVVGNMLPIPSVAATAAGGALCFGLRFMAIRYRWHLPGVYQVEPSKAADAP